jgi:hypothetical protein
VGESLKLDSWLRAHPLTLETWLTLVAHGYHLIPLAAGTKQPPRDFSAWPSRATTDPAQIRAWLARYPGANIGSVIQPGALVLDVDIRHMPHGLRSWHQFVAGHGPLPPTCTSWSGRKDGGRHLWYRVPAGITIPYASTVARGVQVLGPRHCVVMPPSVHPDTGYAYTWDREHNHDTMPLAEAPAWLLELVQAQSPRPRPSSHGGSFAPTPGNGVQRAPREQNPPHKVYSPRSGSLPPQRSTPCAPGPRYGAQAAGMLRDPTNLPAFFQVLGYATDTTDGAPVRCPCPGHQHGDRHPSGTWRAPNGHTQDYGVYCWVTHQFYTLNELWHFRASGNVLPLRQERSEDGSRSEGRRRFLLWGLRLLDATGLRRRRELGAPTLPPAAPKDAHTLWQVILDVRCYRSATEDARAPMPLSYRFLRDWSVTIQAWSVDRLRKAYGWLVGHAWLRPAGAYGSGRRRLRLWTLGERSLRRARREAPIASTLEANVASVEATAQALPDDSAQVHTLDEPRACAHRGQPDFWEEKGRCGRCIVERALRIVAERKRLYGSPPLVELAPARASDAGEGRRYGEL